MKKLLYTSLIAATLGLAQNANAQITLEHTFEGDDARFWNWSTEPILNYFVIRGDGQIKLYAENYSLYKTITVVPQSGYTPDRWPFYFSQNIFTTDGKIVFLNYFNNDEVDVNGRRKLMAVDENGVVIKDFGSAYDFDIIQVFPTSDNKYRISISKVNSNWEFTATEIYSLPGVVSTSNARLVPTAQRMQSPFPNPANSTISLPYKLQQGETSVMRILNINGQLIESKNIGSDFEQILLNVSNYRKGMYIYEVNGVSNRFVVN